MAEATVESRSSQSTSQSVVEESAQDEIGRPLPKQPWSQLAQEFAEVWGRLDPGHPTPEDVEVLGTKGSGKTLFMCKIVQERMIVRRTPTIIMQSKPADETVMRLGWPVISDGNVQKALRERWSIYWPQTNATGQRRKLYQADQFMKLLDSLWHPNSNVVLVWDDVGYIESLWTTDKQSLGDVMEMYLREGRSSGITNVLLKQRPQGSRRVMHSETQWTIAFAPKDEDDRERFAQIFGNKKKYVEVFKNQMDPSHHDFLIKHFATQSETISYVDTPLTPVKRPERNSKARP
jgi:hypothetical protein